MRFTLATNCSAAGRPGPGAAPTNARLQPQRFSIAPSAVGCKRYAAEHSGHRIASDENADPSRRGKGPYGLR